MGRTASRPERVACAGTWKRRGGRPASSSAAPDALLLLLDLLPATQTQRCIVTTLWQNDVNRERAGREHGGNCDIKNLARGSRCFFPVFVKGAGLSLGDLHFSQGDGELSFCGAIEMAGITTLKVDIIKGGVEKFAMTMPVSGKGGEIELTEDGFC